MLEPISYKQVVRKGFTYYRTVSNVNLKSWNKYHCRKSLPFAQQIHVLYFSQLMAHNYSWQRKQRPRLNNIHS